MAEPQKETQETGIPTPAPATVITPGGTPLNAVLPAPINPQPVVVTAPQAPEEAAPVLSDTPTPDLQPLASEDTATNDDTITWTASEFHVHEKSAGWYFMLAIASIALAAVLYLLTRSILTPVVVIIGAITLGVYSTHQPGELEYAMNRHGIRIGSKQYLYEEFRLFIVTPDSSLPELTLIPVKRFMPSLSIRYAPANEDKIFSTLSEHLPFEERRPDLVDSLMHRIRF